MDEKELRIENLEKQLKTKMNQHKMLSDTLYQMINRNVSGAIISRVKDEMDDTLSEVNELKEELEYIKGKEKKVNNIYDSIQKTIDSAKKTIETVKNSVEKEENLYDSISKDFGIYDTPYNKPINEDVPHLHEFSLGAYDGLPFSNRFIVDLDDLGIDSWMVKSIHHAPSQHGKKLYLSIYNHIVGVGPGKYPLYELIENSNGDEFSMKVTYVDPTGVPIYSEEYVGCKIVEYCKSPLVYDVTEPMNIELTITYDYIKYDVNNNGAEGLPRRRRINKKRA